jgi:hypothetical protein
MNFGFAPYSPGLDRPYLYSYVYPLPQKLTQLPLPPKTHWHTTGWIGTVTLYDDFRAEQDPLGFVAETLQGIYAGVRPLLK